MLKTTVVGSYPRKHTPKDTLRKPSVTTAESLEMISWAVKDQCDLGLDVITDGEAYRENMYWFYQLRLDGVDCINKKHKQFGVGGSMEGVDLSKVHELVLNQGGFGIECAVVTDKIENPRWRLDQRWKHARREAAPEVIVKQTITGPHMLARFSVNGPVLSESPHECKWAVDIINNIISEFPKVRFGLHICGGNAHRKRGYFGRYTDMLDGLTNLQAHELHMEHCTLHYNMLEVFDTWKYDGAFSFGVIDQRSDEIETVDQIHKAIEPVLDYFDQDRILISSECGFGHVPLDVTRKKLSALVYAAKTFA